LEDWQQTYGDLGLLPEEELIERWRPGGELQLTEPPVVQIAAGIIAASCATPGASIAWTDEPRRADLPDDPLAQTMRNVAGDPDPGGRYWRLYSAPFAAPAGATLWFRAHRLGFRASADVAIGT
jgi:uncharacterized sulfatase